jgi:hypothetical protein
MHLADALCLNEPLDEGTLRRRSAHGRLSDLYAPGDASRLHASCGVDRFAPQIKENPMTADDPADRRAAGQPDAELELDTMSVAPGGHGPSIPRAASIAAMA